MGNADGMSRRGNKSDYYVTPWQCVQALIDSYFPFTMDRSISIFDPACGDKVIGNVFRGNGFNNIVEEDLLLGQDFLERNEEEKFDFVITNPPYSIKNKFIEKALKISKATIFILPANVINYNEFQEKYLDIKEYFGRVLMRPKFFMDDKKQNIPKLGGISAYAWFMWSNLEDLYSVYSIEKYVDLREYFRKGKENG